MNPIECTFIIIVNASSRLYFDKISDNVNEGTKAIDIFAVTTQLFKFYIFKNRNTIFLW